MCAFRGLSQCERSPYRETKWKGHTAVQREMIVEPLLWRPLAQAAGVEVLSGDPASALMDCSPRRDSQLLSPGQAALKSQS
jgi:hypothetical protein